jgi:hypothetical protein
MDCIECKTPNPMDNLYCGKCGAELGRTLDETVRKKGFRDRQATEIEITEAVMTRLMKWTTWLGTVAGLIVLLFGILVGKSCEDVRTTVATGKGQIEAAVLEGKKDIESARTDISSLQQSTGVLKKEYADLQSDAGKYRQLTARVEQLQKEFSDANGRWQDVDLHVRSLHIGEKAGGLFPMLGVESVGVGCPTGIGPEMRIIFCVQGSPLTLFQVTHHSNDLTQPTDLRPVASISSAGFRDTSQEPKSSCTSSNRGTLYVEKGGNNTADQPFLCAKKSDGNYTWLHLSANP